MHINARLRIPAGHLTRRDIPQHRQIIWLKCGDRRVDLVNGAVRALVRVIGKTHHHAILRQSVRQRHHHRLIARRQAGGAKNQATIPRHIEGGLPLDHHRQGAQFVVNEIKALAITRIDVHAPNRRMCAVHLQSLTGGVGMHPCRHRPAKASQHVKRVLIPHQPMQMNDVGLKALHNRRNRFTHRHLHAIGHRAGCRCRLTRPREHLHAAAQQVANLGIDITLRDMRIVEREVEHPKDPCDAFHDCDFGRVSRGFVAIE